MTKRKPFLSLYLIISLVLVVLAVVLSLTVGFNVGSDIGGGTQFEVKLSSEQTASAQTSKIKSALKEHGLVAEKIFVEDKGIDRAIIVRVAKKDLKDDVRESVAEKLGVDISNVSEFNNINGLVTKKTVLWTSVAVICILLLIFVLGWIRYKLMAGLSLTFTVLHALLLSVSALVITRLPLTFVSLVLILSGLCLVIFAYVLTLERIRENAKLKHNENLSAFELVDISKKATLKPLIYLGALLLIMAIVILCLPIEYVIFSALTFIVCLALSAYSYYFVGMEIYANLLDIKMIRDKQRVSKNPEDVAKKSKPKKTTAQKEKAKADKKKDKELKEKAKAKKAKEKESKKDQPVV